MAFFCKENFETGGGGKIKKCKFLPNTLLTGGIQTSPDRRAPGNPIIFHQGPVYNPLEPLGVSAVPTAPDSLAQGNALGNNAMRNLALKGRYKRMFANSNCPKISSAVGRNMPPVSRPFRAAVCFLLIPRALPWAKESGAVGTTEKPAFY
jgi:hypothetical protein